MTNSPALNSVLTHLKKLTFEFTQPSCDLNRRRELLDSYFAVSPDVMAVAIQPRKVFVGDRAGYWFVPENNDGQRRLLYIHGGSWMSGSINGWAAFMARLAKACDCAILFIDYSLMPEAPFPAGLNDCLDAYLWLIDNGPASSSKADEIFIAGDSAGGNLALACLLALKNKHQPLPNRALAISPCTDFTASGESMISRQAQDPIINPLGIPLLGQAYLVNSTEDVTCPLVSPLFGDLSGLPPLMLQTGEAEVLLDDTLRFAKKAKLAGVKIELDTWPNMPHVFQGFAPFLPQATEAIERIGAFFKSDRL